MPKKRVFPKPEQQEAGKSLVETLRNKVKDLEFYMPSVKVPRMTTRRWAAAYGKDAYGEERAKDIIKQQMPNFCGTAACVLGWWSMQETVERSANEYAMAIDLGLTKAQMQDLCFEGYSMTREQKADQLEGMLKNNAKRGYVRDHDERESNGW